MHFFLLNQYFPPDVAPTGAMLRDLGRQLIRGGHTVTVFCSPTEAGQSENESSNAAEGMDVRYVWTVRRASRNLVSRLIHFGSFYVALLIQLLFARPKPDVIVALTTPPYLGFLARVVALLRGARTVDWIMDLYPEVMRAHGMLDGRSPAYRWLERINAFYLGRSDLVVTLGPDMDALAAVHHRGRAPNVWVPLWADLRSAPPPREIGVYRADRGWSTDETVFLYSGNIGLGHRFQEFLSESAHCGDDHRIRWAFFGRGGRKAELESFATAHPELPVEVGDYVEARLLGVHLAAGDVHLASMDPSWDGCMVPSKFQGSFAAGRPVLFVGSTRNSLAVWLRESGGGWVVPPDDAKALHEAVIEALDVEERQRRGRLALEFARERFDRETNCRRLVELIEQYCGAPQTGCSSMAPQLVRK